MRFRISIITFFMTVLAFAPFYVFAEGGEVSLHFENKQDYFGMGKAKNWALMANVNDDTLVRNRITSWLGDKLGMPFTPQMIPVDLVMGIGTRYL